jgi:hypothetical protein
MNNPHGPSCPWYEAAEKFGAPNLKWCEETICAWISEPANTWSNIAYFIAAWLVYRIFKHEKVFAGKWLAPTMLFMGAMSFIYHMSNNYLTQIFDFIGMYAFLLIIFIKNLKRIKTSYSTNFLFGTYFSLIVFFTLLMHWMYINQIKFQLIVVIIGGMIAATEWLCFKSSARAKSYKIYFGAILFILAAQSFSLMDVNRIMCFPQHPILQGHAIWHVLSATGLYFLSLFYKSENHV